MNWRVYNPRWDFLQIMVIPEERDGKLEDDPNLSRDTTPANATVNTRKGGAPQAPTEQRVRPIFTHLRLHTRQGLIMLLRLH